jgi:hypothetical protein
MTADEIDAIKAAIGPERWQRVLAERRREQLANRTPDFVQWGFEFHLLLNKSQVDLERLMGKDAPADR